MEITKIELNVLNSQFTAAIGSVTFGDDLIVNSVRIAKGGPDGIFVSWPQWKNNEGEWKDYIRFSSSDIRNSFNDQILKEYKKQIALDGSKTTKETKSSPKDEEESKAPEKKIRKVNFTM